MADGSQFHDDDVSAEAGEITPPLQAWREEGRGRRTAPDAVWAAAREDYLAGMSGPEVCARHGVRLTALRDRAAREGWRRIDQPWAPRNRLDPNDEGVELEARVGGDLDKIELCELSDVAFRRMMRAILRGDAMGALRWRRVQAVMEAEDAESQRAVQQHEAIWQARRGYPRPDEAEAPDPSIASDGAYYPDALDASHASDGVYGPNLADATDASDASDGVFSPPGEQAIREP
ncbi:hypothetical protein [Brevundimonas sp.]|uniref:hypothetical protein n=1 Tax=Brevundimonas sp. TaxID=1871086 RepID=UPI002737F139|nr:hypothetical protein [Brevundimonas sp.]MDP3803418.1 hypothetical protein [Brevundimonas sp.]